MPRRLFTTRELLLWSTCFVAAASLIVLTGFTSVDGDSALYANLAGRLVQEPFSHWIAPEWWGFWNGAGPFLEHPAGLMIIPAALSRLGMPAVQAAYVQGLAAEIGSLLLIGVLVSRVTTAAEGRTAMTLLQVMPVAFIFRIRSNHEYPMLFCLALTLVALDDVRRHWRWVVVVALAMAAALLVKGVFVALIVLAAVLWTMLNPAQRAGPNTRPLAAIAIGLATMALVVVAYDTWCRHVTGEPFWGPYWQRQVTPVAVATPHMPLVTELRHFGFYLLVLAWHPAPWTAAIVLATWRHRHHLIMWVRTTLPGGEQRAIAFVGVYVAIVVGLLFPLNRVAERYIFSATFAIGTLGAIVACRRWAPIGRLQAMWATSSAPAALLWLVLILLRLVLGPILPRFTQ